MKEVVEAQEAVEGALELRELGEVPRRDPADAALRHGLTKGLETLLTRSLSSTC
jgi:hypothetical protein